jgi:membrane protein implicated in regulation of membrane protease activity
VAVVVAILLALFVLPSPWGLIAILGAAALEVGESWFWIRFTRRRRSVTGAEGLVGQRAVVVEACRPDGRVRVQGELWRAHCPREAEVGDHVRVARVNDDLTLDVE